MVSKISKVRSGIRSRSAARSSQKKKFPSTPTGGLSTETGAVIVTPSGVVVGSASSPRSSGGSGSSAVSTRVTTQDLRQQSLVEQAQKKSVAQALAAKAAKARQSVRQLSILRRARAFSARQKAASRESISKQQEQSRASRGSRIGSRVSTSLSKSKVIQAAGRAERKSSAVLASGVSKVVSPLTGIPRETIESKLTERVTGGQIARNIILVGAPLSSTATTIRGAVAAGTIVPASKQTFKAVATTKGSKGVVRSVTTTQIGGLQTKTISGQSIKVGNTVSTGRGVSVTRAPVKGGGARFSTRVIASGTSQAGVASRVISSGSIKASKPIAKGVRSRSLSAEISTRSETPLVIGGPKSISQIGSDVSISKGVARVNLRDSKITGLATTTGKFTRFAGTTAQPRSVITSTGIKQRIGKDQIDVRGVILSGKAGGKSSRGFSGSSTRIKSPKLDTKIITQSAISQASSAEAGTRSLLIKDVSVSKIPRTVTKTGKVSGQLTRQSSIPRIKQTQNIIQPVGTKIQQKQPQGTKSRSIVTSRAIPKSLQLPALKQPQAAKIKQIQKLRISPVIRTKQKQKARTKSIIPISISIPKSSRGRLFGVTQKINTSTSGKGAFSVSVRRGGKFKSVGSGLTSRGAFNLGKNIVGGSLAASFKIGGGSITTSGTPSGFKRSKKERGVFIESKGLRLSTSGETIGIQTAKRRKKR